MLAARVPLPLKLKLTLAPGCAAWNSLPRVVNTCCSEAAAKTVILPVTAGVPAAVDAAEEAEESALEAGPADLLLDPQALRVSRAAAAVTAAAARAARLESTAVMEGAPK